MSAENLQIVRSLIATLWERGDAERVPDFYATDFVYRSLTVPDGVAYDYHATLKAFFVMYSQAFPVKTLTIEDELAAGDDVVVRWTMRGRHEGELFGVPASGNDVTIEGLTFFRLLDGKVVEEWTFRDQLVLLQQIGGLPAIAQTSA